MQATSQNSPGLGGARHSAPDDEGENKQKNAPQTNDERCPSSCLLNKFARKPEPEPNYSSKKLPSRRETSEKLYTPLREWQIRVLRLRPGQYGSPLVVDLQVADILYDAGVLLHDRQERVFYEALSHCWGPQEFDHPLLLRDYVYPITGSLFDALQRLRFEEKDRYLWVDAICINQEDDGEKSHQVSKMLTIFKKAEKVVIWLGESGIHTQLLHWYLHGARISSQDGTSARQLSHAEIGSICERHATCLVDGFVDLLYRPWYERAWVKQEVWAARKPSMICGNSYFSSDFLIQTQKSELDILAAHLSGSTKDLLAKIRARLKYLNTSLITASPLQLLRAEQMDIQNPLLQDTPDYTLDLVNVLRRSVGTQCTDPRDHIFALLGMTTAQQSTKSGRARGKDGPLIRVDYSLSACEIFQDVATYFIVRERDLAVLYLAATFGADVHGTRLPSWVPDWRRPTQPMAAVLTYLDALYAGANKGLKTLVTEVKRAPVFMSTISPAPRTLRLFGRQLLIVKNCRNCLQNLGYHLTTRYPIPDTQRDLFSNQLPTRAGIKTVAKYNISGHQVHLTFEGACPCQNNQATFDDWSMPVLCEWDVSSGVREGDVIVLVEGGYTPLMLRRLSPTHYRLLGPVFCTHVQLALAANGPSLLGYLNDPTGDPGRLSLSSIVTDIHNYFAGSEGSWRGSGSPADTFDVV